MQNLKLKIQQYGPLLPEAWEAIQNYAQHCQLKENESFTRNLGTLAYVANGLLKEYDAQNRKRPSIINFIGESQILITRWHNKKNYLKACRPTLILFWDLENLKRLYQEFNELKIIYDKLCAEYDQSISFRQFILEKRNADSRILPFIEFHKNSIKYIRKKDMANYLMLYYDNFIRSYRRLLKSI